MCPHTTIHVLSTRYVCVAHAQPALTATICVLILLCVLSTRYVCVSHAQPALLSLPQKDLEEVQRARHTTMYTS
jgi:hypothetical protein